MKFSSCFIPATVSSVILRGWWRADQGITLGGAGGVAQWNDLSGNGNNLVQATDGYRPLYELAGFNGMPSMRFDGVNDFLSANGVAAFFTGNDVPMTIYLVYELVSVASIGVIWRLETTLGATPYNQHYMNTTQFIFDRNSASTTANGGLANTKYVQRVFFSGTILTVQQNTSVIANAGQNVASLALNLFTIGASNQLNVPSFWSNIRVAELILFSGKPTPTEDMLIGNYINNRYMINNNIAPIEPTGVSSVTLKGWWRADQGITQVTGVSQWDDISGNGNHLTQASGTAQPTFEAGGYNGQPSLLFDGTNDYMLANGIAALFTGNDIPMTVYIVYEIVSNIAASPVPWGLGNSNDATHHFFFNFTFTGGDARYNRCGSGSAVQLTSGGSLAINTKYVQRTFYSGTATTGRFNGTQFYGAAAQNTVAIAVDRFSVGALLLNDVVTNFGNMRIAEMFIYTNQPNVTEDNGIAAYLYNRYGILNAWNA
jgi:hypothetical protein